MKTTNKKLQLKKETMAVLNDKSLFGVIGGGNPNEEDSIVVNSIYINQCYPSETCPIGIQTIGCHTIVACESLVNCGTGASPCKNYTKQLC